MLQLFLLVSQVLHTIFPLTVVLFSQLKFSIIPYYAAGLVFSAFSYALQQFLHALMCQTERLLCSRTMALASASIADVVDPTHRAAAFSILMATLTVGFCVASVIVPVLSRVRSVALYNRWICGLLAYQVLR